jgi:hypothetical protein
MSKAASSTASTKGTSSSKKATTSRTRAAGAHQDAAPAAAPEGLVEHAAPAAEAAPETQALTSILQRLDQLEEKIAGGFAALASEVRALQAAPRSATAESGAGPDTIVPLIADALRHNLMEHLTPVTAALKRLEERIGFVANRLKFSGGSGGGQDRQKPWRGSEQGRHPRPPRGQQNGQQRQPAPQSPQWTPPSAASVQGHFAPRPSPGRGFIEEDE